MDEWKDAVFLFESGSVPDELKLIERIATQFNSAAESATTLLNVCHSIDEAAATIDAFKAKTCGSAYTLAVINLNMFGTSDEFNFMMQPTVLGDPRTIFVASMKSMAGDMYTFAKNKVNHESETQFGAPSCIDCYGASNRDEAAIRLSKLTIAYIHESERRVEAKRSHSSIMLESDALRQLKSSTTTYYGNRGRTTGIIRRS